MASGSRNTLFGMTLTELVIILFIMLLLALDSIDDLNDQIPDSSEDVVAASAVVELLIPDGEINSDLIPFEVIKDEIAKLQKDKEELEDIKQASEGDGTVTARRAVIGLIQNVRIIVGQLMLKKIRDHMMSC